MVRKTVGLFVIVLFGACTVEDPVDGEDQEDEYVDPGVQNGDGKMDGNSSVESVVSSTCSTTPVRGLSMQIAEEVRCLAPGLLVPFEATASIRFASMAVLPYLETETAAAVQRAAPNIGTITINSGLRSIAQQYLLRRWKEQGRCGIRSAALPGRSNHETGRALDIANPGQASKAMSSTGFSPLAGDPVHFDHLASPDLRDVGTEAFQRLWNRNHPEDPISEDGSYGPQTAARLARAPSGGFAKGAASCY